VDHRFGVIRSLINRLFVIAGLDPAIHFSTPQESWITGSSPVMTPSLLMPEMPHAGQHHGDAVLIGGLDHLIVAH
jgi:hypothetical protein